MNNTDYKGPRRLFPDGERPESKAETERSSDSGALSRGFGRRRRSIGSRSGKDLQEPMNSHFQSRSDPFSAGEESPEESSFYSDRVRRPEIEPLDDDLVNYDEFGRKRKPKRIKHEKLVTKSRIIWGWIIAICIAVGIALAMRAFVFEPIVVEGESMEPTLLNNERLAVEKVSRYFGLPARGDVIIVHYPNMDGTYVKRVIGLPGETVEVKDSTVYINGEPLTESYINTADAYADMAAVTVPENTVFVMGDNRAHSLDSRTDYIGPIARGEIVGHAMYVIWPFDKMHAVQ